MSPAEMAYVTEAIAETDDMLEQINMARSGLPAGATQRDLRAWRQGARFIAMLVMVDTIHKDRPSGTTLESVKAEVLAFLRQQRADMSGVIH